MGEHGNIIDKSDDWYTPKYVFDALGCRFDLDVAAPKEGPRYVPADRWFWERGLEQEWSGFVWMNPPFGHQNTKRAWLQKFLNHSNGIALLPDRTSAPWWQWAAPHMDKLLFVSPKIKFERPDGSIGEQPGSGTVLMALGAQGKESLKKAARNGLGVLAAPIWATPMAPKGDAAMIKADKPLAWLIEGERASYLQFTPDVADCDKNLVRITPLYAADRILSAPKGGQDHG